MSVQLGYRARPGETDTTLTITIYIHSNIGKVMLNGNPAGNGKNPIIDNWSSSILTYFLNLFLWKPEKDEAMTDFNSFRCQITPIAKCYEISSGNKLRIEYR
jgi:hypothetical protein